MDLDFIKAKVVVRGLLTNIPGALKIRSDSRGGATKSAIYCYEVWLKHLTMLWESGLRAMPNTVAEIGPGDSLGVGLASLLSGANNYYALDVVERSNVDLNLKVLEELIELFKARAGRPTKGWPDYDRYLDENLFPKHILTDELLSRSLSEERISLIRNAVVNQGAPDQEITIKHAVPWIDEDVIDKETVDLILSHSVLEHVDDLEATYRAFGLWLVPKGVMSHQIDFEAHGVSTKWNGYRGYSEFLWKIIMGKRKYLINRQPCSVHMGYMKNNSFKIISHLKDYKPNGIKRSHLSSHWKGISEDDLACSGTFVQAQKE